MAAGELSLLREQPPSTCTSLLGGVTSGERSCKAHERASGRDDDFDDSDKSDGAEGQADSCEPSSHSVTSRTTEDLDSSEQLHDRLTCQSIAEHVDPGASREQERAEEGGVIQSEGDVLELLSSLLHGEQTLEHLEVSDSQAVTVGNVTYVLGDIKMKEVVQENTLKQQIFVKKRGESTDDQLQVVSRKEWLAEPPSQPVDVVEGPLDLVIINHTASLSSETPALNMILLRRIQLMHMEGQGWFDIAYNFLVGMDGVVYEGRGWGIVGSHTKNYNAASVGVAFIGHFMQELPSPEAVASLWRLLEQGVRLGHLSPDYRILGYCQCRPSESPGRAFFSLIQTWPRWAETAPPPPPEASITYGSQQSGTLSVQTVATTIPVRDDVDNGSVISGTLETAAVDDSSQLDSTLNRQLSETASEAHSVTSSLAEEPQVQDTVDHDEDVSEEDSADTDQQDETSNDQAFTGDWYQERKAVHVSNSRNVRVGEVAYVLGSLNISQVLQTHSVEKRLFVSNGCQEKELRVVRRSEWRARPPARHVTPLCKPATKVVLCHTDSGCVAEAEREAGHLRTLQEVAVHGRGLEDIHYNFLVGGSGCVFEGRGWDVRPGLPRSCDDSSVAVAFVGAHHDHPPTAQAVEAFHQLMAVGEREGHLSADWRLLAHCQLHDTDSPGRALYQLLKTWPRWAGARGAEIFDLKLVSRVQWLAIPAVAPISKLQRPVKTVVICHTRTKEATGAEGERRQMRSLQNFEVHCRGRADLPFHFVVAPSGAVYEGRGWELAADLSLGVETDALEDRGGRCLVVALMGTFCRHLPTPTALHALDTLLALAQDRGVLAQDYHLVGHCQLAGTISPGGALFSLLKQWPHWTNRPFGDEDRDAEESDHVQ
ncbi:uncharacterized protein LOC126482114 [Schistocerca serialis cubense]|uniref:uncharacterized protein LOC126482114 n=1 Tax=Schistocerca serialis cubense TaxID=2023355 RepID=UPI00214F0A26|nr:uncharacterized protein LOC126482114 [Schistocerca serialis cubense]